MLVSNAPPKISGAPTPVAANPVATRAPAAPGIAPDAIPLPTPSTKE